MGTGGRDLKGQWAPAFTVREEEPEEAEWDPVCWGLRMAQPPPGPAQRSCWGWGQGQEHTLLLRCLWKFKKPGRWVLSCFLQRVAILWKMLERPIRDRGQVKIQGGAGCQRPCRRAAHAWGEFSMASTAENVVRTLVGISSSLLLEAP